MFLVLAVTVGLWSADASAQPMGICGDACDRVEIDCGAVGACEQVAMQLGIDLQTCDAEAQCASQCVLDATCSQIFSLVGMNPDPMLSGCMNGCLAMGAGGGGNAGSVGGGGGGPTGNGGGPAGGGGNGFGGMGSSSVGTGSSSGGMTSASGGSQAVGVGGSTANAGGRGDGSLANDLVLRDESGCSCRAHGTSGNSAGLWLGLLLGTALMRRRTPVRQARRGQRAHR